jgi:hypothetical protein
LRVAPVGNLRSGAGWSLYLATVADEGGVLGGAAPVPFPQVKPIEPGSEVILILT